MRTFQAICWQGSPWPPQPKRRRTGRPSNVVDAFAPTMSKTPARTSTKLPNAPGCSVRVSPRARRYHPSFGRGGVVLPDPVARRVGALAIEHALGHRDAAGGDERRDRDDQPAPPAPAPHALRDAALDLDV